MAKNTGNNRISVKWVRDKAKAGYTKDTKCYICGTTEDLELHHLHSITVLLTDWIKQKGYTVDTDEDILAVRDEFINEHRKEIYEQVYTLCNRHHVKLHGVYGKAPPKGSEPKQERWINMQKEKHANGGSAPSTSYGSFFSQFI